MSVRMSAQNDLVEEYLRGAFGSSPCSATGYPQILEGALLGPCEVMVRGANNPARVPNGKKSALPSTKLGPPVWYISGTCGDVVRVG